MAIRSSTAQWEGDLKGGKGTMTVGKGAYTGPFSFASRFEESPGTNPEELIAAAHAGCFSMALTGALGRGGFEPARVATTASVQLMKVDGGFAITGIELRTEASVPGIDEAKFQEIAEAAKQGCPVSKALAGTKITLVARLIA
jgi:osmotically inducible protein OsmC